MKFAGRLTPLKIVAFLLIIEGFVLGILLEDVTVALGLSAMACGLLGLRKGANSVVDWKQGRYEQK